MNARTKLNTGHFYSCLLFAALAGWLTGSWLIFLVVAAVLMAGGMHAGDIRLEPARPTGISRRRQ